jgi:IS30 family transposase
MPESRGKHLTRKDRDVIEAGICNGSSARSIARSLGVSASTVTREIKANRTVREKKAERGARLAVRCISYKDCQASGTACKKCSTRLTTCKMCKTRSCIDTCPDFMRTMCATTKAWPHVCPSGCPKRGYCGYPKCSYRAADADGAYRSRLISSREGIDVTPEELEAMNALVAPLVRQGQSFEAIWATHAGELPVGVRTAYSYQAAGILETADIELPRKVRMKKRRKNDEAARERIDRAGRTYADFQALALADQARVVQGDSVVGYQENQQDLLSLYIVARAFQIYLPKAHADAAATVACLDAMERSCGSREVFEAAFGIMLVDRGVEFDDWEGMERSCLEPGCARCRVFYCDPMVTNQKSEAERNHEQLRRILPKKRSDFDALSAWDVATCTSHVNSYPSAGRGGKCPFELLGELLPQALLDDFGIQRMAPDEVILKPYLIKHAVVQ